MNELLESKLAKIVDYLDRQQHGTGAHKARQDDVGLCHLLNERDVSDWLEKHRKAGISPGPIIK